MKIIRSVSAMHTASNAIRQKKGTLGLVPTMGALHEGHLSLVRRARKENHKVVVSIFVNPLQFGPKEDFKAYPRDLRRDRRVLRELGVDILFCPAAGKMYPEGFATAVSLDRLSNRMCGASRPGHFQGVATVVAKLFNSVKPHRVYFGQKDAQQAVVIRRMVKDLNMDLKVVVLPIVREADGLAMSSRNRYLTPQQRKAALCLFRSLQDAKMLFSKGERSSGRIRKAMERRLLKCPFARIDYIALVNSETLEPVRRIEAKALVALAVYFGRVRLIDNCILRP